MLQANEKTTTPTITHLTSEVLERLLTSSRPAEGVERRACPRYPFFAPVGMRKLSEPLTRMSAFTREISESGVGLLHYVALEAGAVYRFTCDHEGTTIDMLAQVVWCRPAGEGWYLSGCRFVQQ